MKNRISLALGGRLGGCDFAVDEWVDLGQFVQSKLFHGRIWNLHDILHVVFTVFVAHIIIWLPLLDRVKVWVCSRQFDN